jgi:uncharacterized protein (TIGR00661 family)
MNPQELSPKPVILVAPLDWGLGHATRSVPIIHTLIRLNCSVLLAGNGKIKTLLQKEFPQLPFLDLEGYNVSYSARKWSFPFSMATQIPKIFSAIENENLWLADKVKEYGIEAVISDNRYGLYHRHIPTVFMTHQLLIRTSLGRQADKYLQQLNYNYINQFTECWIPDQQGAVNLAGDLSHPLSEPSVPLKYLGPLSRFSRAAREPASQQQLLVLLSGPEPQRTILERLLSEQLIHHTGTVTLVRGLPGNTLLPSLPGNIFPHNHLSVEELEEEFSKASFVIARCGYSTIMDLAVLQKKGILIPTPGQTEQEYLAKHLMDMNFALCIEQSKFRLKNVLDLAMHFPYRPFAASSGNALEEAVRGLILRVAAAR